LLVSTFTLVSTCRIQHIQKKKGEKHAEKEIWPLQTTVSMLFNRTKKERKELLELICKEKVKIAKKRKSFSCSSIVDFYRKANNEYVMIEVIVNDFAMVI
jgi:hypothetical protein